MHICEKVIAVFSDFLSVGLVTQSIQSIGR